MRLFLAIDLDDEARRAIAGEQKRLAGAMVSRPLALRWVRVEEMHLTLEFLGEVDESRAVALVEAMDSEIAAAPFTMVCSGLGTFPQLGPPKVLWVGVTSGYREVVELRGRIGDRLLGLGIVPDARPYHPHLTLGRWRTSHSADRVRALDADLGQPIARVEVSRVSLFQSELSSTGARHTVLAQASLRA